jgi:hypothetical protein
VPYLSVWGLVCPGFRGFVFTSLSLAQRATLASHHLTCWSNGRKPLSQQTKEVNFGCTKELGKTWEPTSEPYSSDDKEPLFEFRPALRGRKGVWLTPSRDTQVTPSWGWNHVSQFQGVGWKCCAVWECVKMWAWNAAQLKSKFRVLIHRSMVNSYGPGWALTGPLVWGLYILTIAKRLLNPH